MQYRERRNLSDIFKYTTIGGKDADSGAAKGRLALGIGVFDGVHLGHRVIVDELCRIARAAGVIPAAMTFHPHPRAVLRPEEPPILLVPLSERIRLLRAAGAERVLVVDFTPEFACLEPEEFLNRLLGCGGFALAGICVGEHWRFGRCGRGNRTLLKEYALRRGLSFSACPELLLDGEVVSSSAIRRAVASGRLEHAARLLGRSYRLVGRVEYGYGAASGRLDCPTANVSFSAGVLPPDGVYAVAAWCGGKCYPAAANVGFGPTFGWAQAKRRLEVHLLDFSGDLYGSEIGVEFLSYLREERTFPDPEALKAQIGCDLIRIRDFFAKHIEQRGA